MRRAFLLAILTVVSAVCVPLGEAKTPQHSISGAEIVREMNRARQHPDLYAAHLEELRRCFRGRILLRPRHSLWRTHEGVGAVDEAIRFLRRARPLGPLAFSPGMSLAAAEHVADQAGGAFGHDGSDRSNPSERMNRYGLWSGYWGENISYGKSTARDVVIALLIDDGLRSRKHRKNIFNAAFNYAGAAAGPHARYRTVCSMDFAAGYTEGAADPQSLFARN